MSVIDAGERLTALDPVRSFCVGAPAGSGKTELLIQRYLTLLARVVRPEQVLAITFTRKAAAEMQARVLEALLGAQRDEPCSSAHQQHTRNLALRALEVDTRENWQLVRNISRFNIKTIDSFCSHLTRQMPVLSQFGGQAEVVDNASPLYAEAVVELFKLIESDSALHDDLAALMLHFDNDWARLQELLISMLARRDQWRGYIGVHHRSAESESWLQHTVEGIVTEALTDLATKLAPHASELLALQQYSAANLGRAVPAHFPSPVQGDLPLWRDLRRLLLTAVKEGRWRAKVDVKTGFPAGAGIARERKQQFLELLHVLSDIDGLREGLNVVSKLPETGRNNESWQLVLRLSRILPRLAAELLLVFARHGRVDHSQVSLSALQAMGEDELPTQLALRLDYQLEHILVDEFQDTAINQFELVRRLTRGWGEHNERNPLAPRTLLVVGDGMQSIYGFRDANVGLFLQARNEGFNGVPLEYLSLRSNFRSDEGIVRWVNATFAEAFPGTEDVSKGQIRFTEASAVRPAGPGSAVSMRSFTGAGAEQQEVDAICETVRQGLADESCASLAVLARTRGHLQAILAQLKSSGINYSAQDVDSLAKSIVIMDLLSLCRALINPADRVAWMAILRAPWCGLLLADLHVIGSAGEFPAFAPMSTLLGAQGVVTRLSVDGQKRVAHLWGAMTAAEKNRDRFSLRHWIEELWLQLGGPATVGSQEQLHDAERFFTLLEQAEQEGEGLSLSWLQAKLEKLYVQAENPGSKVQVMTLHKAKGLEFDWVIIPALQKTTRTNPKPLMLWDDYSSSSGERGFLLAADDHSEASDPTLYNWLREQRADKGILETTRLLYVGVTRAVKKIFLTTTINYDEAKEEYRAPPKGSLLACIWPTFCDQMVVAEPTATPSGDEQHSKIRTLYRLQASDIESLSEPAADYRATTHDNDANIPLRALNRVDRYVGTVVHLALERLSRLAQLPTELTDTHRSQWHRELARLGLFGETLASAFARVESSVTTVLADPQGRWILSSKHPVADSELRLTRVDEKGRVADIIIDRTFIDRETNERWLIDYKNSEPEAGESLEDFSTREATSYSPQLAVYREVLEEVYGHPVKCALYFTALALFSPVDA